MPVKATAAPREQVVCAACRGGLVHRLVTLHAGEQTLLVCSGIWDGLPAWLTERFGGTRKNGGLTKRRESVAEIRKYIETNNQ